MDDIFTDELEFDWDEGNKDKNWIKHRIRSKEAEEVFTDNYSYTSQDLKHSLKEKRYQILGTTKVGKKLSVVFTLRNLKIRIISVRLMNRKERKKYENEKQKIIANS